MSEFKVSKDVAESEFERFVEEMDLLVDENEMDAEDRTAYGRQRQRIVRAIQKGDLVINEDGEAVYTPSHRNAPYKEPITFYERTGATVMEMDGKKANQAMRKTYAVMGAMCRVPPSVFANMIGTDIKVCEAIYALLMD